MSAGQTTALPSTSLIICSRNRHQLLLETVESILDGEEVPAELVIVDQSDEPSAHLAHLTTNRACEVSYLWTRSVGLGRARNTGVEAARYPIVAFVDDDMWVAPGWFGALIHTLVAAGPRALVTGQVQLAEEGATENFAPSITADKTPRVYEGRIGSDKLSAGNMAMYRSAYVETGGFDERLGAGSRFPSAEDNDFGFRALEAGYRVLYDPAALVYHRAWRPRTDFLRLRWHYGRGQGAFYAKHLCLRDPYILKRLIRDLAFQLFLAVLYARRQRLQAKGHVVFVFGAITGAIQWLLVERIAR